MINDPIKVNQRSHLMSINHQESSLEYMAAAEQGLLDR